MADNFYQATVSPELPAALFTEEELAVLELACGLSCDRIEDRLYFYADTSFREEGEYARDGEDVAIDCLALLREKLRRLDPDPYPHIAIQGAATCSRMRPDEFGGFAILITREEIRSLSTGQWLDARKLLAEDAPPGGPEEPAAALRGALQGMLEVFVESDQLGDYEDMATVKAARAAIVAYDAAGARFEPEARRPAAVKLLEALQLAEGFVHWALDHGADRDATGAALAFIRAAIGEAQAAGLAPAPGADPGDDGLIRGADSRRQHPIARKLLAALTRLLDDITDAEEDRNPETGEEYASVTFARSARDEAHAAGLTPVADPHDAAAARPDGVPTA